MTSRRRLVIEALVAGGAGLLPLGLRTAGSAWKPFSNVAGVLYAVTFPGMLAGMATMLVVPHRTLERLAAYLHSSQVVEIAALAANMAIFSWAWHVMRSRPSTSRLRKVVTGGAFAWVVLALGLFFFLGRFIEL